MKLSKEKAAKQCGITTERLTAITKRKDFNKNIIDAKGLFDIERLASFVKRIKQSCAAAKRCIPKHAAQKKLSSVPRRPCGTGRRINAAKIAERLRQTCSAAGAVEHLTFEEFKRAFWQTDDRWQDFVAASLDDKATRRLIHEALMFGYATAFPAMLAGLHANSKR